MVIERIVPLAKQLLVLQLDETHSDTWLWEHSERVMNLAPMIAHLPEIGSNSVDTTALAAAALFHDAGWISDYEQGRVHRWQLLGRPTNDIQRELGAATLAEEAGHLLPGPTAVLARDAIQQCNNRETDLLEARILAEAEALDEIGAIYVLRQFRQYQAEGRPLRQIADSWQRQKEYDYWEVRLNDGFQYELTRALARRRLEAVDAFMTALGQHVRGGDLGQLLREFGVAPDSEES